MPLHGASGFGIRHAITVCRMQIDPDAGEHAYLQLARILRERIESGEIGPRVPSLTAIAEESGLAVVTIRKAMNVLTEEGLIYTVPGRGTFVTPR
jgi:GntR family transcriptional regulator